MMAAIIQPRLRRGFGAGAGVMTGGGGGGKAGGTGGGGGCGGTDSGESDIVSILIKRTLAQTRRCGKAVCA